jgi:threonine aldolase
MPEDGPYISVIDMYVGPKTLIRQARHFRKLWGGGWRQSGPLAEAARFGVEYVFLDHQAVNGSHSRMKQDHENARWLAQALQSRIPEIQIANKVQTNMVFVDVRKVAGNDLLPVSYFLIIHISRSYGGEVGSNRG